MEKKRSYKIAVLPGDGIGPEVMEGALKILKAVSEKFKFQFSPFYASIGGAAIDKEKNPLPARTLKLCKDSDAVLLGAVGGPKWDKLDSSKRPENGLLSLRKELGVYANLRPAKIFPGMEKGSTLKKEVIKDVDLIVVRELSSGIYYGKPRIIRKLRNSQHAINTMSYSTKEIERIARIAFQIAKKRRKEVTSVDKANVLECSQLWRKTVDKVSKSYPDVKLSHLYVDNCSMQLVRNPKQFDVILTENLFGDILSDEAAMLTGSIGMLPSASLGDGVAIYEPVHGSAPDIAGKNKANPIAMILSVAYMLRYSFNLEKAASAIENAVKVIIKKGYRTPDIFEKGKRLVGTKQMSELIKGELLKS